MGIDLGELRARITVSTNEAETGIRSFQDKLKSTGDTVGEVGKRLTRTGAIGVGAIGALTMKGAEWNAQVAGTEFIFNNLDKAVQKTIKSNMKNAEAIGLTSQQYKDGATSISTYYKNMGMTTKEIVNMSGKTMELVADLGALKDIPFDEALSRFKSGLMGNYEALDIFGISISAGNLEQGEYVKSLGKTWRQLSENEKMMAIYNEITRQSTSAHGLAKHEAQQFSMQMNLLKREISETAGKLGETLLPILEPYLKMIRDVVNSLAEWIEAHPKLTGAILGVVGALSLFTTVTGGLFLAISGLIGSFLFWKTVLTPIVGFLRNQLIAGLVASTLQFSIFGMSVSSAFKGLMLFLGRIPILGTALAGLSRGISFVLTGLLGLTPAGVLGLVIKGFQLFSLAMLVSGGDLDGFVKKIGNAVKNGLTYLSNNLPKWIEAGKKLIDNLIKGIAENLPKIIEKSKEIIKSLIDGLVSSIGTIIEVGGKIIDGIIQGLTVGIPLLIEGGQKLLEALVNGIVASIPLVQEAMTTLMKNIQSWIANDLPAFIEKGADIIVKLIEGITTALPIILEIVVQIITTFAEGIAIYLPLIIETGIQILNKLIEGIVTALPFLLETAVNIINGLVNAFVTLLPVIIDTGVQLLTSLIEGIVVMLPALVIVGLEIILTLINGIVQALPQIIEAGIDLILKLVDAIIDNLPKIIDAGVTILTALIEGLIQALPQLIEAGFKLIVALAKAIKDNMPQIKEAGRRILKALIEGIMQLIGSLLKAGLDLVVKLAKSVVSNAPKMLEAGKNLVKAIIEGLGSLASSLWEQGGKIVNSILDGIKANWGKLKSWVGSSLSNLNPFKGGKMIVGVEGSVDEGGISQLRDLTLKGITSRPSHFGFAPRQGLFNLEVPNYSNTTPTQTSNTFDKAKEIVVNTVVELEGYQIAKASARYLQEELSNLNRRSARLGGVL